MTEKDITRSAPKHRLGPLSRLRRSFAQGTGKKMKTTCFRRRCELTGGLWINRADVDEGCICRKNGDAARLSKQDSCDIAGKCQPGEEHTELARPLHRGGGPSLSPALRRPRRFT